MGETGIQEFQFSLKLLRFGVAKALRRCARCMTRWIVK